MPLVVFYCLQISKKTNFIQLFFFIKEENSRVLLTNYCIFIFTFIIVYYLYIFSRISFWWKVTMETFKKRICLKQIVKCNEYSANSSFKFQLSSLTNYDSFNFLKLFGSFFIGYKFLNIDFSCYSVEKKIHSFEF